MSSDKTHRISHEERLDQRSLERSLFIRRVCVPALCALVGISLVSCVVPLDTGANAAAMALDEMDNLAYSMSNQVAQLQVQIDSLSAQLRKQDSLVRWVANLTGNPIVDAPVWTSFPVLPPPDTGAVTTTTKPPPTIPPPSESTTPAKPPPG